MCLVPSTSSAEQWLASLCAGCFQIASTACVPSCPEAQPKDSSSPLLLAQGSHRDHSAVIFCTATLLSFPQLQNMLAALAHKWSFAFYAWMHSDVVVLQQNPLANASALILDLVEPRLQAHPGTAFLDYDRLAVYSTRVSVDIRYFYLARTAKKVLGPTDTCHLRCSQVVLEHPWDEDFLQNYM